VAGWQPLSRGRLVRSCLEVGAAEDDLGLVVEDLALPLEGAVVADADECGCNSILSGVSKPNRQELLWVLLQQKSDPAAKETRALGPKCPLWQEKLPTSSLRLWWVQRVLQSCVKWRQRWQAAVLGEEQRARIVLGAAGSYARASSK
jgi:hypothetical protein